MRARRFPAGRVMSLAAVVLGLGAGTLPALERLPVDLKLIPATATRNTIDLTVEGNVLGTTDTDTDSAAISGNMLCNLGLTIDPETYDVIAVETLEFTGGRIAIEDTSFSLSWFLVGELDIVSVGLGGTFDTPNPPGTVVGGTFSAAEHEVTLDEGVFQADGSGLLGGFMPENPYIVDMSLEPVTVTTDASGTIAVSLVSAAGGSVTYDVTLTLPLTMDQVVFEEPDTASIAIRGSTTLESRARIVLVPDYGKIKAPAVTGLEEANAGATSFTRGPGDTEIEWALEPIQVTTVAAVDGTFKDPANPKNFHQFHLNNASVVVTTERIDVRGATDVQVSMDLRTWDASTGFEVDDGVTVKVLVSRDGILFEEKPWLEIRGTAATALDKGEKDGIFTTFRTQAGFLPDDAACIRLAISANTNSNNEHILWDDIRVGPVVLFRRADCDSSGSVDVADAVVSLLWLFAGGRTPACLDACDASDDGRLNVSDVVFTLNWLFGAGRVPPAPGPGTCGPDGTPSTSVECQSYSTCG